MDHVSDSFLETNVPLLVLIEAAKNGNEKEVKEYAQVFREHANKLIEVMQISQFLQWTWLKLLLKHILKIFPLDTPFKDIKSCLNWAKHIKSMKGNPLACNRVKSLSVVSSFVQSLARACYCASRLHAPQKQSYLAVIEVNLHKSSYKSEMKGWTEDLDEWAAS